ncbi:Lin0512 family protein [Octadecabacter sp.]|nr:Lin0512 family protein [Octadecabacter sp.]MDC1500041.1 Lin0512 family protein [Octadecabacter sp.]MDG1409030.1 Lin0512 family protein [Octadecabacter sp.]|tara:strand:+ start:502 stop:840 length:339 start_codon:yes stop_codon:yes gene_type:complete
MATRLLTEFGMGTSLRRQDYTQAARRALQDALWHNSINLAELYGMPKEAMQITVEIGVQQPDAVDTDALADIFPYGQLSFLMVHGGLDVPRPDGLPTVIANVALSVALEIPA